MLTVPGTQTTVEDVAVKITGIAVADGDVNEGSGAVKVTLSVGSGILTVSIGVDSGLTASQITGNGTSTVVLQGPLAAVNATLAAGVTYRGNLNFSGTDALTVVADDLGNAGAGGALTDSQVVSIQVMSPTHQIAELRDAVDALSARGALNQGQANSLLKKLVQAQSAIAGGKTKVGYNVIGASRNDVQSLTAAGVLPPDLSDPLLTAADLLVQSLLIGGGF